MFCKKLPGCEGRDNIGFLLTAFGDIGARQNRDRTGGAVGSAVALQSSKHRCKRNSGAVVVPNSSSMSRNVFG
jgi:hypothetical protein